MIGAHKPAEESGKAYQNTTLVGNWYEDRIKTDAQGLETRMVYTDIPPDCKEWQPTSDATNQNRYTAPPPAAVKKPSMYNESNITERLQTYGEPSTLTFTLGNTVPRDLANPPQASNETTNKYFYQKKPDEQRDMLSGSAYFAPSAHTHHRTDAMLKETLDTSRDASADPLGSKGARGEITRRPVEAGSAYGVSVFVDEYAKWPQKLEGQKLSDTVAKKTTQHF